MSAATAGVILWSAALLCLYAAFVLWCGALLQRRSAEFPKVRDE